MRLTFLYDSKDESLCAVADGQVVGRVKEMMPAVVRQIEELDFNHLQITEQSRKTLQDDGLGEEWTEPPPMPTKR